MKTITYTGKQVWNCGGWICPNPSCPAVVEAWASSCHECGTRKPKDAEIFDLVKRNAAEHRVHWTLRLLAWLKNVIGLGLRQ